MTDSDKCEQYDGFWLHPQVELRTGVVDKDGGRGVFLKRQPSTVHRETAGLRLAPGTLLLAETALLRAETYEKMVAKMRAKLKSCSSSSKVEQISSSSEEQLTLPPRPAGRTSEGELLRLMHPVGVTGIREKIEHNWHTADGELDPFTGFLDPLRIRSGHGLAREIAAVEEDAAKPLGPAEEDGDGELMTSAPPEDLREYSRHRLSAGEVEKLWKQHQGAKADVDVDVDVLGLWPVASLINHSFARPNVARSFSKVVVVETESESEPRPGVVKLIVQYRLIRELRPGEEVLDNYLDLACAFPKRYQVEHEQHKIAASRCTPDAFDGGESTEEFLAAYEEIKQQEQLLLAKEGEARPLQGEAEEQKIEMLFGLCGAIAEAMDLGGEVELESAEEVESGDSFHAKEAQFGDADASPGSTATSASSEGGDVGGEVGDAAPYRDPAAYPILVEFGKALFGLGFLGEAVNMGCRALQLVLAREDFSFHSCLVLAALCHWMSGGKEGRGEEKGGTSEELEAMEKLRNKHFRIVFGETLVEEGGG